MSHHLPLIAANGTAQLLEPIRTQDDSINHLLDSQHGHSQEANMLMAAGLMKMRQSAGYIPDKDARPIDKAIQADEVHEQVPYSPDVVRCLTIIHHEQYLERLYREWLHWAALTDAPVPYEVLPYMLNLATKLEDAQELSKRLVGSRGRWLVEHSGHRNWYWLQRVKPARRPRLTKYEKLEGRIAGRLQQVQYRTLEAQVAAQLRAMTFPWSLRLSKIIMRTMLNTAKRRETFPLNDLEAYLGLIQWFIHPSQIDKIIDLSRLCNGDSRDIQFLCFEVQEITDFRRKLRAAFGIG